MCAVVALETAVILWWLLRLIHPRAVGASGIPGADARASHAGRLPTGRLRAVVPASVLLRRSYSVASHPTGMQRSRTDVDRGARSAPGDASIEDVLELLPMPALTLGEHGIIVTANAQTANLFGYVRDELPGTPFTKLVPEPGLDGRAQPPRADRASCPESRRAMAMRELSARRKDGSEFRVELGLSTLRAAGADTTLAVIVDRTDRCELHRNRLDLAHLARVSTMGQLAASLAHELNQPLTAILSNVQAAQRFMAGDPVDLDEVREILGDIVKDDYRASEVIRRIRAVVKKGDLEVVPLDLAGVIRDVFFLVRSDAIVRGTRIELDIDRDLPPVRGDRVQLQQVLLNLLLNAFDAMSGVPPADRVVKLTLEPDSPDRVRIAVRDRGHGLTTDKLDKIFKPFVTSKPQGLGLGLSICQSIVDMHRGRLWAENNTDRGATFYVVLPAGSVA
jgi:two-component system sensor kinase FixL